MLILTACQNKKQDLRSEIEAHEGQPCGIEGYPPANICDDLVCETSGKGQCIDNKCKCIYD